MDFLKENQKLKIIPEEIKGISQGVVKEIDPQYFVIELDDNKTDFLKIQDSIEIIIPIDSGMVKFEANITEINVNRVSVSIPEKFKYLQRREYERIDINIPVKLKENDKEDEAFTSTTKNISGGGMLLLSSKDFNLNALLNAEFSIFSGRNIEAIFEILRSDWNNEDEGYNVAGQFKKISNTDRTAIIQMCFKRQTELKYKEMRTK